MAKLTGAAKKSFLARMRRGRAAAAAGKAKKVVKRAKKTVSNLKIPKRRRSNNVARRGALPKKSRRRDSLKMLYDKKNVKQIAIKTAIGLGLGITIKLVGMFSRNRTALIIANRAAPVVAAYAGGGTGELAYQGADFIITRGSLRVNGGSVGFQSGGA